MLNDHAITNSCLLTYKCLILTEAMFPECTESLALQQARVAWQEAMRLLQLTLPFDLEMKDVVSSPMTFSCQRTLINVYKLVIASRKWRSTLVKGVRDTVVPLFHLERFTTVAARRNAARNLAKYGNLTYRTLLMDVNGDPCLLSNGVSIHHPAVNLHPYLTECRCWLETAHSSTRASKQPWCASRFKIDVPSRLKYHRRFTPFLFPPSHLPV